MKNILIYILLGVSASVVGIIATSDSAHAGVYSDWGQYGNGLAEGYFSNGGIADTQAPARSACRAEGRCPVLPNEDYRVDALDRNYFGNNGISSEERARRLVSDLRNKYNGQGEWGATGAAFIVNSMLGRGSDSPQKTRTIDDATWADLERRLVDRAQEGKINWNIDLDNYGQYDTYTVNINGRWDVSYNNTRDKQNGIEIRNDDGSIAYRMWYSCANPIGDFNGLQQVNSWSISGKSYIKNSRDTAKAGSTEGTISAAPGDQLNWYHDMRNVGPSDMDRDVYFNVDKTGFSNGWNDQKAPLGNARGANGVLFVYEYANENRAYTRYTVGQNDVGNTLCQRIGWNPGSSSSPPWQFSNYACATIPYKYELVPAVTLDRDVVEANTDVPVVGTVVNNGPTKSRPNTDWQVVQVIVPAGSSVPSIGPSAAGPCSVYSRCTPAETGSSSTGYPAGSTQVSNSIETIGNINVGDKVCFGLSIKKYTDSSEFWVHSALVCLSVSKKPMINVTGGDVIVGKGAATTSSINTSTSVKKPTPSESRIFGSWGEYALIANGSIQGMASAAGYSGGQPTASSTASPDNAACSISYLTITNAGTGTCTAATPKGGYAVSTDLPAISTAFSTVGASSLNGETRTIESLPAGTYTATTNLTLSGGEVAKGKTIIINAPTANVSITGNIDYFPGQLGSAADLPQLVIIANTIAISGAVQNVDAWLIATGAQGNLITCSDVPNASSLRSTNCSDRLTVNGPVVARHAYLYRTAGAGNGADSGKPAEVFNLRPDAYVWASNYQVTSSRLQTTSTVELPPRY